MRIEKSSGTTPTEKLLADLCEATFLKLWSYPNPYKSDGKELCDLIAVFENHVFVFFDRESLKLQNKENDILLAWERWKRTAIDKQIDTALGAERYLLGKNKIFLDAKQRVPFPISIPEKDIYIHKIIVAHGASEACRNFSADNISGSLAICYGENIPDFKTPFLVPMNKKSCVHLFDSENIEIILRELDTFFDFKAYIVAKEKAIQELMFLNYCGEEDLLAHYFQNFDDANNCHYIGTSDKTINGVWVAEGEWKDFSQSKVYSRKNEANKVSYFWDDLIQKTAGNALDGTLLGDTRVFHGQSAIIEMAKEPRFSRRTLSECMLKSGGDFPDNLGKIARNVSFFQSYYPDTGYVFLQIKHDDIKDYDNDYRPKRQTMLQIACGAAKIKFTHLKKIVGIAIEAPKFSETVSEDFVLLLCDKWSSADTQYYRDQNKVLGFFEKTSLKIYEAKSREFPDTVSSIINRKIGRNEPCPCGSGKKFNGFYPLGHEL